MTPKTRAALAAVLFLLFAVLLGIGQWRGHGKTPRAEKLVSPVGDCRQCHAEAWRQWQQSPHARAWSSPEVQAAFQHYGFDRKCQSCHAPQPILVAGLNRPVAFRAEGPDSGVACRSCHLLPDGRGVAARRALPDAPCRPQCEPQLSESRLCGACHEAIYQDWQASRYCKEGKTCRHCHMAVAAGEKDGGSHRWRGSRDPQWVRSSCRMDCRREKENLVVSVTNQGAGHNFPGERHHRVLLVQVIQRNAAGEIVLARQQVIKGVTPFRGESSAEKIKAGETCELQFPVVQPPGTADVQLLYKTFPWVADRDALVVHRTRLKLEE